MLLHPHGYQVIYTSSSCMTGTDRLAEASKSSNYDYYINIQGDEPLLDPADIQACVDLKLQHPNRIINCFTKLSPEDDPHSINIPKVVVDSSSRLLYISRSPYLVQREFILPRYYLSQTGLYLCF